jgi:transposase
MKRFVEGVDRQQNTLFPECLEDWICEDDPVRVIDVFVGGLDLGALQFGGVDPEITGRPSYHPSVLLKLYLYGYLNRVQSSRRLEREAGRNVEVMWLTGRLVPDHKTIADFRKDNGPAIRKVCAQFVMLCRRIGLLTKPSVAIDGSNDDPWRPSGSWVPVGSQSSLTALDPVAANIGLDRARCSARQRRLRSIRFVSSRSSYSETADAYPLSAATMAPRHLIPRTRRHASTVSRS